MWPPLVLLTLLLLLPPMSLVHLECCVQREECVEPFYQIAAESDDLCVSPAVCCEQAKLPPALPACGVGVRGSWMARVTRNLEAGSPEHLGSAVFVKPDLLLTAAHLVHRVNVQTLRVADSGGGQERRVSQVLVHPRFRPTLLLADLALLVLEPLAALPKDLPQGVHPCLADPYGPPLDLHSCVFLAGKGEMPMGVVQPLHCERGAREQLGPFFHLHGDFLCALPPHPNVAGPCQGEGGGALLCPRQDGGLTLVGVLSWGLGGSCGTDPAPPAPAVFTNIAQLRGWMDGKLGHFAEQPTQGL